LFYSRCPSLFYSLPLLQSVGTNIAERRKTKT
jgi:hypothetical protein